MIRLYYDFHIHSCLSPCGDDDMTVNNIAGMAKIKGLDIIALTDHNSLRNCPSFFKACERLNIIPIAGTELTTSEEIHMVCLFESLLDGYNFSVELDNYRSKIKNRPEIFGNQYILNDIDEIVGTEQYLLPNATSLSLEAAYNLVISHNGVCFPAHADKESNGIISILGIFPDKPEFNCIELSKRVNPKDFLDKNPVLKSKIILQNSDAHSLNDISEAENYIELDIPERSGSGEKRKGLFGYLKGKL
ncbi:MAG: PHP domain-containing protein [Clostridiales bacterium]|jgi:PHP family Zn ribbon phosphoesterase|nr:PHP domain-containing protein [Clostridiales bacterium]